jgi:hypothetical protein
LVEEFVGQVLGVGLPWFPGVCSRRAKWLWVGRDLMGAAVRFWIDFIGSSLV